MTGTLIDSVSLTPRVTCYADVVASLVIFMIYFSVHGLPYPGYVNRKEDDIVLIGRPVARTRVKYSVIFPEFFA